MSVTLLAGTTTAQTVNIAAKNPVVNFSVDGSTVQPRRTWWSLQIATNATSRSRCTAGFATRSRCAYCVTTRRTPISPNGPTLWSRPTKPLPPQGINFALLVHRIHDGVNVTANGGKPFVVVGFWEATTTSPTSCSRP